MIFQSYLSMLYIRIDICHLVWRALRNFPTDMADMENVEEIVGPREAEAVTVVTGQSVRRGRHLAPSGRREAVGRSVRCGRHLARRAGRRPSHGRSVGCGRHLARRAGGRPSHGRSVGPALPPPGPIGLAGGVARSVGPARPPPGPVGPAGGSRTNGMSCNKS